jgi:uncharacterized protein (TIGR02598 family)
MRTKRIAGFSLVEVTLALGVSSFGMLAIFGLLPVGLSSSQTSGQQTMAANIATAIVADMNQVPNSSAIAASSGALNAVSPQYSIDVTGSSAHQSFYTDGSGKYLSKSYTPAARYSVSVNLAKPASGSRQAPNGVVAIAWPAAAPKPLDQLSVFVAFDRN